MSSQSSVQEGGGRQQWGEGGHVDVNVNNEEDIMFLDIINSSTAAPSSSPSSGGSGSDHPDEDEEVFLEIRVSLMDRLRSMNISPSEKEKENEGLKDKKDEEASAYPNVDPSELIYPCSYPTCYWVFPSHPRRLDHIVDFHLFDLEETAPLEWYQLEPSIQKTDIPNLSDELDLIQELLEDNGFSTFDI